jgi:hypothetical protein
LSPSVEAQGDSVGQTFPDDRGRLAGARTDSLRTRGDAGSTGFDLMYGIRFRY